MRKLHLLLILSVAVISASFAADPRVQGTYVVPNTRTVTGNNGLDGGGALDQNRTIGIAAIANQRVLANGSGGSAVPSATTISSILDWIGSTRGSILYRGAAGWAVLAPGTSGHALVSNGAGADPSFQAIAGSGDVTAASSFGNDNRLIRSDGTSKGVQSSGVTVDDSDNISTAGSITAASVIVTGTGESTFVLSDGGAAAMTADDTYAGLIRTGLNNSGGVTQWDAVYLNSSSQWVLADANGSGTYPCRGIAVATVATGNATTILTRGTIRNDAWNWTPGGTIYLSTTAGGLTQTAPSTTGDKVQIIGYALDADTMAVEISPDYGTAP